MRVERDAHGELRIPRRAYWGIGTARRITKGVVPARPPRRLIQAVAALIRAATMAAEDLSRLRVDEGEWVAAAAQEVADSLLDAEIIVDTAADLDGEALLLNVREVVANRANELMGGSVGTGNPIHPDRKVAPGLPADGLLHLAARVAVCIVLREEMITLLEGPLLARAEATLSVARVLDLGRLGPDDGSHARLLTQLSNTLSIDVAAGIGPSPGRAVLELASALGDDDDARAARALAQAAVAAEAAAPELPGVWAPLLVRAIEQASRAA